MLKVRLRLSGVNVTWKRVAAKLELARHGLSDLDSMMRSAEASGRADAASSNSDFDNDGNMVVVVRCEWSAAGEVLWKAGGL